jgi:phosphoesterase RecJ-like protein
MTMNDAILSIAKWLRTENGFTLIAHVSPDGDTIGSSLALYGVLTAMGKRVRVVCDQRMPATYAFLPYADRMTSVEDSEQDTQEYKNAIAVDCADMKRMGESASLFQAAVLTGNIDHHRTNPLYGNFILHDDHAAATGELIYAIWRELGAGLEVEAAQNIAICLFTAISTDTGNFSYSNTTPETFHIAGALLVTGFDISTVNRYLYRTVPLGKTRLLGFVLSNMQLYENGKIGMALIRLEDLDRLDALAEDAEGTIDGIRDVASVEIAILVRQSRDGTYKASMRSKEFADVSAIAHVYGGGGHVHAAGCTLEGEPEEIMDKLLAAAKGALA